MKEHAESTPDLDLRAERYVRQLAREYALHRQRSGPPSDPALDPQDHFEAWAIHKLADLQVVVEALSEQVMRLLEKPRDVGA